MSKEISKGLFISIIIVFLIDGFISRKLIQGTDFYLYYLVYDIFKLGILLWFVSNYFEQKNKIFQKRNLILSLVVLGLLYSIFIVGWYLVVHR